MDSNVSYPVSHFLFFFFLYSLKVFLLTDCLVFYLWLYSGCDEEIFHPSLGHDVFQNRNPRWKPDIGAQATNWPHTFFLLQHQMQADDRLLRGEVLAILAAIRTRLDLPELSEHIIVPVSAWRKRTHRLLVSLHF